MKKLKLSIKKLLKVALLISLGTNLCSCAALSAIKGFVGSGENTNRSVNVEANLAARDNNKSIISSKQETKYSNKGNVVQRGIMSRPLDFSKLITYPQVISSIQETIEELIILLFLVWLIRYIAGRDERIMKRKNKYKVKLEKLKHN